MFALVPRTVAEGGEGADAWRLRAAPGIVEVRLWLDGPGQQSSGQLGVSPPASLGATQVWSVPTMPPTTLVVGPTPRGADSVRVTSEARGVAEASIERLGWRRLHVHVIEADSGVRELVAIGEDGRVLQAVSDPPRGPVPGSRDPAAPEPPREPDEPVG